MKGERNSFTGQLMVVRWLWRQASKGWLFHDNFKTTPIKRRKSHPSPCPRYCIFELSKNERDFKKTFSTGPVPFSGLQPVAWVLVQHEQRRRDVWLVGVEHGSSSLWTSSHTWTSHTRVPKIWSWGLMSGGVITIFVYVWRLRRNVEPWLSH